MATCWRHRSWELKFQEKAGGKEGWEINANEEARCGKLDWEASAEKSHRNYEEKLPQLPYRADNGLIPVNQANKKVFLLDTYTDRFKERVWHSLLKQGLHRLDSSVMWPWQWEWVPAVRESYYQLPRKESAPEQDNPTASPAKGMGGITNPSFQKPGPRCCPLWSPVAGAACQFSRIARQV